jgi:NADH:ubiquinone oxidoreductase subunit 6 (subunit J)
MALICVLLFLISVMFRGAANDIKREKDRNYIVALFSGIVSFVALIISIIALYRGGCGC